MSPKLKINDFKGMEKLVYLAKFVVDDGLTVYLGKNGETAINPPSSHLLDFAKLYGFDTEHDILYAPVKSEIINMFKDKEVSYAIEELIIQE